MTNDFISKRVNKAMIVAHHSPSPSALRALIDWIKPRTVSWLLIGSYPQIDQIAQICQYHPRKQKERRI